LKSEFLSGIIFIPEFSQELPKKESCAHDVDKKNL